MLKQRLRLRARVGTRAVWHVSDTGTRPDYQPERKGGRRLREWAVACGSGGELGLRRVWGSGERDSSALGRTGEGAGHGEGEGDGELSRLAFRPEGEEGSFPFFYKFSICL